MVAQIAIGEVFIASGIHHFRIVPQHAHADTAISKHHQRNIGRTRLFLAPTQQTVRGQPIYFLQIFSHAGQSLLFAGSVFSTLFLASPKHILGVSQSNLEWHSAAGPLQSHRYRSVIDHFIEPNAHTVLTHDVTASIKKIRIMLNQIIIERNHGPRQIRHP